MKILFIHQHYFPEMGGATRRTKELAEFFQKKNNEVHVLTTLPRKERAFSNYNVKANEYLNGILIFRLNNHVKPGDNVFSRLLSYSLFVLLSLFWLLKRGKRYDLIITIAPLASGICGAFINKYYKIPHHFDLPDIHPDLGISGGMLKNKILIKLLYKIEKIVYKYSDTISPLTKGQIQNLVNKGVNPSKIKLFPDWVDNKYFKKNRDMYNKVIKQKLYPYRNHKLITFMGNIGVLQNLKTFLKTTKLLNSESNLKFKFLFIGDGVMLTELKKIVKKEGIKNVIFIGRVERKYIPSYLYLSDILVANYANNKYLEMSIPGKTYEYLATGKPIIIGARGSAAELIRSFNAGIAVEPSNEKEFKNAILEIINNPGIFSFSLEKFISKYDINSVLTDYYEFIENEYGN